MIRSRIVTKIGHLTHNQVVAGSSPAGPGGTAVIPRGNNAELGQRKLQLSVYESNN